MDGADSLHSRSLREIKLNQSMLAQRRERVEQLTTGEISHRTENNANLPPSVAKRGGQGR